MMQSDEAILCCWCHAWSTYFIKINYLLNHAVDICSKGKIWSFVLQWNLLQLQIVAHLLPVKPTVSIWEWPAPDSRILTLFFLILTFSLNFWIDMTHISYLNISEMIFSFYTFGKFTFETFAFNDIPKNDQCMDFKTELIMHKNYSVAILEQIYDYKWL